MFNLGAGELVVLALLALIFLGPRKLPELWRAMRALLARSLGPPPRAWARNDWILVGAILLLVTIALSLAARG